MKLIIANWKMNPFTKEDAVSRARTIDRQARAYRKVKVVIAPPFPFLFGVKRVISTSRLGAQNVFFEEKGAYTGEVSSPMLRSLGVTYVIVGHSERREYFKEIDGVINKKVRIILSKGLHAVLCVGERNRNEENFQKAVKHQLIAGLTGIPKRYSKRLIIVYEPVWAIGTGKTVHAEDLYEMAMYIRRALFGIFGKKAAHSIPVLYGGSVTSKNAEQFLLVDGVNGLLVGGASLDVKDFGKIIEKAAHVHHGTRTM